MGVTINYDRIRQGVQSQLGVTLTPEEIAYLERQTSEVIGTFDQQSTVTTDFGGTMVKYATGCMQFLKSLWRNWDQLSFDKLGELFEQCLSETTQATDFSMLQQQTMHLHGKLRGSGMPGLIAAADLITGQSLSGQAPPNVNWNVYGQIRATLNVSPEIVARGPSLDFSTANQPAPATRSSAEATEITPPGRTPAAPTNPALTAAVPAR